MLICLGAEEGWMEWWQTTQGSEKGGDQVGMEAGGILGFGLEGESGKEGCPSNV